MALRVYMSLSGSEVEVEIDQDQEVEAVPWYVYLLESSSGATYVGATVDPDRRLRQHNGELKGGARATAMKCAKGETWKRVCMVGPFGKIEALRFEWRWKFVSRKQTGRPLEKRWKALQEMVGEDHTVFFN
jgi:structure-specific endonuclease subunit SLX1